MGGRSTSAKTGGLTPYLSTWGAVALAFGYAVGWGAQGRSGPRRLADEGDGVRGRSAGRVLLRPAACADVHLSRRPGGVADLLPSLEEMHAEIVKLANWENPNSHRQAMER